jgi:hypothetical protein
MGGVGKMENFEQRKEGNEIGKKVMEGNFAENSTLTLSEGVSSAAGVALRSIGSALSHLSNPTNRQQNKFGKFDLHIIGR